MYWQLLAFWFFFALKVNGSAATENAEDLAQIIRSNFSSKIDEIINFPQNEMESNQNNLVAKLQVLGDAVYRLSSDSYPFDADFYNGLDPVQIKQKLETLYETSNPFSQLRKISKELGINDGLIDIAEKSMKESGVNIAEQDERARQLREQGFASWQSLDAWPEYVRSSIAKIASYTRNTLANISDTGWQLNPNFLKNDAHNQASRMNVFFRSSPFGLNKVEVSLYSPNGKFHKNFNSIDTPTPDIQVVINYFLKIIQAVEGPMDFKIWAYLVANPASEKQYFGYSLLHHFDHFQGCPCSHLVFVVLNQHAFNSPEELTLGYPLKHLQDSENNTIPMTDNAVVNMRIPSQAGAGYFINQERSAVVHGKSGSPDGSKEGYRDILVLRMLKTNSPNAQKMRQIAAQRKNRISEMANRVFEKKQRVEEEKAKQ